MTFPSRLTANALLPAAVLLIGAFVLVYYQTTETLAEYWSANDTYSYAFLVPLISAYVIWLRREELKRVPVAPAWGLGSLALAAGLLMLIVGRVSSTNLIEAVSLLVSLCGLILLTLGTRMMRALAFPVAYLLAMIPFWDIFTNRLHAPFQMYSAALGVGALRLFGIPVLAQGVFIELPDITLEVA